MIKKIILSILLLLFISIVFILLIPINVSTLLSKPNPAKNYEEALNKIAAFKTFEPKNILKECSIQFLTHNKKVEFATVLVHGYTNCPEQFKKLGEKFYNLGHNVLIAPLPYHGISDKMTSAHSEITAEKYTQYGDTVLDIAEGIGNKTIIVGLSCGGVIASWAAQFRHINKAVIISPAFGFPQIPTSLTPLICKIFSWLPNKWINKGSELFYVYPRYSTYALTQMIRLGISVRYSAQNVKPKADSIVFITNANDKIINNSLVSSMIKMWKDSSTNIKTYEFEKTLELKHDFIDPNLPNQKLDLVYPILIDLITKE
ncbi:MAG: alpha/beta hydrolase [Desulfobacterales bacterium]|nr:alpha/beta hydrolase [Desulfobacterales bacterium]